MKSWNPIRKQTLLYLAMSSLILTAGCSTVPGKPREVNTIYASFGDCIPYGSIAVPKETSGYSALVGGFLNHFHPRVTLYNCGVVQATSLSYSSYLPAFLKKIAESKRGPVTRATLLVGTADMTNCKSVTLDPAFATKYKADVQVLITEIRTAFPSCKLVLCNNIDPNNGGLGSRGPYTPPGILQELNKKISELGNENNLPVADLYKALMGHPEWYIHGDNHPNNAGHAAIAAVIEEKFDPEEAASQPRAGEPILYPGFDTVVLDH